MDSYVVDTARSSPVTVGRQAIVVGAGIGGLAAAGALADWFDHVLLIERDAPPDGCAPRPGTPQAAHSHGLLGGGQLALAELFPGFDLDMHAAGVPVRFNEGLREELPDGRAMPGRDFGLSLYAMSRWRLEHLLYRRVLERGNITLRHGTSVLSVLCDDRQRAIGVSCVGKEQEAGGGTPEVLDADLVVDATGRGRLTPAFLEAINRPAPRSSTVGIDLNYTTVILPREEDFPEDWRVVITHNSLPSSRRALMLPIENDCWMLTVAGCGCERPAGSWEGVLAHLQQLATRTIYNVARRVSPIGEPVRFGLSQSIWRHYERLGCWPDGLIPLGDAICRFNPVYGQGMSVAAREAGILHRCLRDVASRPDPLRGLGDAFLAEAKPLIETPWTMAALPDFALPGTRGERPAGLARSLEFSRALRRMATRDPQIHRLLAEVWHLLKPYSAFDDPELVRRVEAEMEQEQAHAPPVTPPGLLHANAGDGGVQLARS